MVHFANVSEVVCGMKQGRQPFVTTSKISRLEKGSFVFCFAPIDDTRKRRKRALQSRESPHDIRRRDAASFQSKCRATRHPKMDPIDCRL